MYYTIVIHYWVSLRISLGQNMNCAGWILHHLCSFVARLASNVIYLFIIYLFIYLFIYYIIVHEVQNTHIQRKIGSSCIPRFIKKTARKMGRFLSSATEPNLFLLHPKFQQETSTVPVENMIYTETNLAYPKWYTFWTLESFMSFRLDFCSAREKAW